MPDGIGCAVHAGAKLYFRAPDGTQTELCADMNEAFSQSFTMKGVLYLMDGKTYRAVRKSSKNTAWEAVSVSGTAYVPTTTISAAPTGGGTSYEAVNLLTPKRINTFIGDGTATQFKVDATDLDETAVTAEVNGSAVTVSAVNRSTGMVTLAAAPANGNGLANVSIAFAKTVSGHADKIDLFHHGVIINSQRFGQDGRKRLLLTFRRNALLDLALVHNGLRIDRNALYGGGFCQNLHIRVVDRSARFPVLCPRS